MNLPFGRRRREERYHLALLQVELLASADNSDPERADRQLRGLGYIRGVVESHAASVHESDAALAHHCADLSFHDQRGVFVDSEPHERGKLSDRDE